jgi:hypothetical protein
MVQLCVASAAMKSGKACFENRAAGFHLWANNGIEAPLFDDAEPANVHVPLRCRG